MQKPYYQDESVSIFHGDAVTLGIQMPFADAIITDPPYGETNLKWDRWPDNWPSLFQDVSRVLWCFGSMRMFIAHIDEFGAWSFAQDVVWEKHNGSGSAADRFRRVHEHARQFYRGAWNNLYKKPVMTLDATKRTVRKKGRPQHGGNIESQGYESEDGGPRLVRSVLYVPSCHGYALHPTQKPEGIIRPLIEYSVPTGGLVLDPFMGSGTTLRVAADMGCRAIGIDSDERSCEIAATRMQQRILALKFK